MGRLFSDIFPFSSWDNLVVRVSIWDLKESSSFNLLRMRFNGSAFGGCCEVVLLELFLLILLVVVWDMFSLFVEDEEGARSRCLCCRW